LRVDHPEIIAVVGSWHQATVVAATFADLGHFVRMVDLDGSAIARLIAGQTPVLEPGLEQMIRDNRAAGRLDIGTDFAAALAGADFVLIAHDTPVQTDDTSDLGPIWRSVEICAPLLSTDSLLVITSQVPVRTCRSVAQRLAELHARSTRVAYVPEFLRLGSALESLRAADRFVVGALDPRTAAQVAELYGVFDRPVIVTSLETAEMCKHASNSFLATSISFINEIADVCAEVGADVGTVARALRLDARVGPHAYLDPGIGYSGGTLARDVVSLTAQMRSRGRPLALLESVLTVNRERIPRLADRIRRTLTDTDGGRIGILGLVYKPGTNTLRRSPAVELVKLLAGSGAHLIGFDPGIDRSSPAARGLEIVGNPESAFTDTLAMVVLTRWPAFRNLDWGRLRQRARRPLVIDAVGGLDPTTVEAAGWEYQGVGPRPEAGIAP
jgi:UDPglucose 6-dehydrogenase